MAENGSAMNNRGNGTMGSSMDGIAKNKFLLIFFVIVVVFLVVFFLIKFMQSYFRYRTSKPSIVENTKLGRKSKQMVGKSILKSLNQKSGLEFSYTFWMHVQSWEGKGNWKHIFNKGNMPTLEAGNSCPPSGNSEGSSGNNQADYPREPLLQAPGVWLRPDNNTLHIQMNTHEDPYEYCEVKNIPMNKWVCVAVVVMDRYVDVYINGDIKIRHKLNGIPRQNNGNMYVNYNGGFDGFLSRLVYYDHALNVYEIDEVQKLGPSTKLESLDTTKNMPPYLSRDWWQTDHSTNQNLYERFTSKF